MTFSTAVIPFIVAAVIVLMLILLLKIVERIFSNKIIVDTVENVCSNLSITSHAIETVIKMNSIPNDTFRDDKSISCLDYLCIQEEAVSGIGGENTIITCLNGVI